MRIGVLAGEASGDILGARVLAALRKEHPQLVVEGIGGPLMQAQGLESMYPMERLSVMGFIEPLKRLPELLRIRRQVFHHFRDNPPDVFLGIDSPDFNLRLEYLLRRCGVTTAHLVSPSVWAWRRGRITKIRRAVDLMLCLFPFEMAIYREHGVPVSFVGHPLADEIEPGDNRQGARAALGLASCGKVVALLPGSRGGEVRLLAPPFLDAARLLHQADPQLSFVLPAANAARHAELKALLTDYPDLPLTLIPGRSREVMAGADAVLLASGTATLEAALLQRPMVVAYRMGWLTWWLVSRMVKTPYAALPNVLAGRAVVPELLQDKARPGAMMAALGALLEDDDSAGAQLQVFGQIHRELRQSYGARCAAALIKLVAMKRATQNG